MSRTNPHRIESIFYPTDFSPASEVAFAHALAIAVLTRSHLTLLHAGERAAENWQRFPEVRRTLEAWGLLEAGSRQEDVARELAVHITKIDAEGDPRRVCLEHVDRERPDLAVLAVEGRQGLARWLRPSTAQEVARRSGVLTLFVPEGCRPIVHSSDGALSLERILVPVDHTPDVAPALAYAMRMARGFGSGPVSIRCLHVGEDFPKLPSPSPSDGEAWTLQRDCVRGPVVDTLLAAAESADLIVMSTDGRDSLFDAFRGSVTERVVSEAPCPVLAVPVPG